MEQVQGNLDRGATWHSHVGIPIRSLWILLMYASGLAQFQGRFDAEVDEKADLPDLLGRLLVFSVERRLRRDLSRGYQPRAAELSRVRGRIDWLTTEAKLLLHRGRISSRFEELTHDRPRNRLVLASLDSIQAKVRDLEVAQQCRRLARTMVEAGVSPQRPTRAEISRDVIGRNDSEDLFMVAVAQLALDMILPSEVVGGERVSGLNRDEHRLRLIFEKAVAGFYRHELHGRNGWNVRPQVTLSWAQEDPTPGLGAILPSMSADVVLQQGADRRIVLDTKFARILTPRHHTADGLESKHIYQLYSYLRSQDGQGDGCADRAEGILLYPSLDRDVDEAVTIQGHRIRFVTVNLRLDAQDLRQRLLDVVTAE